MNQVLQKQPNENFFFTNYEEKVNENYILNGIYQGEQKFYTVV